MREIARLHLPRPVGRWGAALVGLVLALGATPASAHPHIWVTMRSQVVFENGAIVGLRHAWTFDEYYSATAIDGLDTNKDGIYSREELAELGKVNVEALKDFGYFTFPRLGGAEVALGVPKDYWLEHGPKPADPNASAVAGASTPPAAGQIPSSADRIASAAEKAASGVLTLHFTVPLAKPVLADGSNFSFGVGDPTFFIAFEPAAGNAVTIVGNAPKGCHIATDEPKPDGANPSKPGDLMASQPAPGPAVSFASANEWKVVCKPPA